VGVQVVSRPARHDDDVGLGLRLLVERDRLLLPHVVGAAERFLEHGAHERDDRGVARALRLSGDEEAVEQLDPIFRAEDARLDEAVISLAWHPPQRKRRRVHGCCHDTTIVVSAQPLGSGPWESPPSSAGSAHAPVLEFGGGRRALRARL